MQSASGENGRIIILTRKPDTYSATRFAEAGKRLNLNVEIVDPHNIRLGVTEGKTTATNDPGNAYAGCTVIPRLSGLATEYSLAVLRQLELAGCATLNSWNSLLRLRYKFTALGELARAGIPVPDTEMLRAPADLEAAVERLGGYPLVLKFLRGSQGVGVVYAPDESVVQSVLDAMNMVGFDVMLQRYYPLAARSDLRLLVLNGKVCWSVYRLSKDGRFRSNFHLGGTVEKALITHDQEKLALDAAAVFGLGFAGVDIVQGDDGDLVLEVNGSPGFEAVDLAYKTEVAEAVLESLTGG